mgnify:CR=1 FL=1
MNNYNERRERDRTPFVTDVTLICEDGDVSVEAELQDISIIGMFIRTDRELRAGTTCEIIISISAKNSRLILEDIYGEVIRVSDEGAALRFTSNMEWFVLFKIYTHYSKNGMMVTEEEL